MRQTIRSLTVVLVIVAGSAMAGNSAIPVAALSAGTFTVQLTDQSAFTEPAPVLTRRQREVFMNGRSIFNRQWASIKSLNGDWGLGPTFIADRCSACHLRNGRGHPPASTDEQLLSMLVRVSVPGSSEHGGPKPHPDYGDQLQNRSLDGSNVDLAHDGYPIPHEADVYLDWEEQTVALADGETASLRKPKLRIENPAFGSLDGVMTSLRVAQPLVGVGFLDAVPEETILALARAQQKHGINGRANYVRDDIAQKTALGRYGWKANVPSLRQQSAGAALGDMGVISNLYPQQNCPPVQTFCAKMLPGNVPELADMELDALVLWLQGLAVPAPRNFEDAQAQRGAQLFAEAQCSVCHTPEMKTGPFEALPQLSNQTFHAYTDLLLHDMGDGLADGRPDFQAGPRDWRTPPLWGLGLTQTVTGRFTLLHDGRARNVTEAILWHGGEAKASRDTFAAMPRQDREALVKFVEAI